MNWTLDSLTDQSGKVAIVTGSNSGIGFETAKALASSGAHVIMACRNMNSTKNLIRQLRLGDSKIQMTAIECDLADLASVRKFASEFKEKFPSLDLLINNAGIMALPFGTSKQGFEQTFATNHLGHFALTGLLLDHLKKTKGSRIVNLSSLAHRWGVIDFENLNAEKSYSRSKVYSQSKLANLLFNFELTQRFKKHGVQTIALAAHPGWTKSNLQAHAPLVRCLNPIFGQTAKEGALPTLFAATAAQVNGGDYFGPNGRFELTGTPKKVQAKDFAQDPVISRKLWEVSEKMTSVSFLN